MTQTLTTHVYSPSPRRIDTGSWANPNQPKGGPRTGKKSSKIPINNTGPKTSVTVPVPTSRSAAHNSNDLAKIKIPIIIAIAIGCDLAADKGSRFITKDLEKITSPLALGKRSHSNESDDLDPHVNADSVNTTADKDDMNKVSAKADTGRIKHRYLTIPNGGDYTSLSLAEKHT